MDLSCATAGEANATAQRERAAGGGTASSSPRSRAAGRRRGMSSPRRFAVNRKNAPRVAGLDDAAAMQQHDVAGEPARLAEIVGRHHHLDAARGDGANDVLDRLGGGGIEARGRLVEEQHGRIARQRAGRAPAAAARRRTAGAPAATPCRRARRAPAARRSAHRGARAAHRPPSTRSGCCRRRCAAASPGAGTRWRAGSAARRRRRPR